MNALFGSVAAASVLPAAAALSFPSAEADPIFAAIEAHRAAQTALRAECKADPEADDWPSMDTERDTHIAVLTTVPTTAAGIAAVLEYVGSPSSNEGCLLADAINSNDELGEAGENFLDQIAAAVRGLDAGAAEPAAMADTSPDPIFAVIRKHSRAHRNLVTACAANELDFDDDPEKGAALDASYDAHLPLFATSPKTLTGALALLRYLGSPAARGLYLEKMSVLEEAVLRSRNQIVEDEELTEAIGRFPRQLAEMLGAMHR
jgi:hypothetical protein